MVNKTQLKYVVIIFLAMIASGCHRYQLTTLHLGKDERLLKKNVIKIHDNDYKIAENELKDYLRQKPNKAILGGLWKPRLQWKNIWYNPKKDDERPAVILDTNLIARSEKQLEIYLQNQGFYNAKISHHLKNTRILWNDRWTTKKTKVYYDIHLGKPVIIDSVGLVCQQKDLKSRFRSTQKNSKIKMGNLLKMEDLQAERERIAQSFQNVGFYDFNSNYISFDVDTTKGPDSTAVITKIKMPAGKKAHQKYGIGKIFIQTDFDPYSDNNIPTDTLLYEQLTFLSKGDFPFKPAPIARSIFIQSDGFYSLNDHNNTYRQLANLQMFKFIKIDYEVIEQGDSSYLDVYIKLTPSKKMSISLELNGTYREGFGSNGLVSFSNRNAFGGSEILEFSFTGGFENLKQVDATDRRFGSNVGPRLSLTFPRLFLLPKLTSSIRKNAYPKSTISAGFNYQQRVDYRRYQSNLSLKYEWNEGKYKKHELSIPDFTFSFITKDSKILTKLDQLSASQKFKFEDAIVAGMKYSFKYNNQNKPGVKNPIYFQGKVGLIGPTALLFEALHKVERDENNAITLFGIRYATFVKFESDVRKYLNITPTQQLAFRSFTGVGISLDKYGVIPFDQLYFAGGANSIRGWRQRTLGPGAFNDPNNNVDKLGEIKGELNAEYRFPIAYIFKGALFLDAGNIWTSSDENSVSNFVLNKFYKEIAVATGLGVRLDFDFFLFRVDFGVPIKQPYAVKTWKFEVEKYEINFGVGYPF